MAEVCGEARLWSCGAGKLGDALERATPQPSRRGVWVAPAHRARYFFFISVAWCGVVSKRCGVVKGLLLELDCWSVPAGLVDALAFFFIWLAKPS